VGRPLKTYWCIMRDNLHSDASLSEVHQSVDTTQRRGGWRKLFSFLGPAYLVSVGYMDPGNWATDLQGGSKFGYQLIWVLLMSNLMALLLQGLSARLGIVRGRDLAQANREAYPKYINFMLYLLAEVAIAATDLAEVLGMAIGINLLTGLPLHLQRLGMRKMEAFIIALVAVVAVSFLTEIIIAKPNLGEVAKGFVPSRLNSEALLIAIGIIGATVMPHNLYLHSALVQTRKINKTPAGIKQALRYNLIDSTIALNIAFFVNAAILVLAATAFFKTGNSHVGEIKEAHQLMHGVLGSQLAPILFAVALIAAGQSSTITGTLAGQIVMEGYLRLRINPILRRLLTRLLAVVPALVVILLYGEAKVAYQPGDPLPATGLCHHPPHPFYQRQKRHGQFCHWARYQSGRLDHHGGTGLSQHQPCDQRNGGCVCGYGPAAQSVAGAGFYRGRGLAALHPCTALCA
jgi:manganese transport protein